MREPSNRKVGGQEGHEGTTLECKSVVDEIVKHSPTACGGCGVDITNNVEELVSKRQLLDLPIVALQCIEHQVYKKQCCCGHTSVGNFPKYVTSPVQYGPRVESLIAYLHGRQYIP